MAIAPVMAEITANTTAGRPERPLGSRGSLVSMKPAATPNRMKPKTTMKIAPERRTLLLIQLRCWVIRTAKVPQAAEEPQWHQHHQRQPAPHARRVDDEVHQSQRKQHARRDDGVPGKGARPRLVTHGSNVTSGCASRKPVVPPYTAGGDAHDNLPVSCLTRGFPDDCPAKMPGEGALNAAPSTHPSKGAVLPVWDASAGSSSLHASRSNTSLPIAASTPTTSKRARHAAPGSPEDVR
jgi:hypothetical protein